MSKKSLISLNMEKEGDINDSGNRRERKERALKNVVVISGVRTPVGRYMGALKEVAAYDLGALVLNEAIKSSRRRTPSGRRGDSGAILSEWRICQYCTDVPSQGGLARRHSRNHLGPAVLYRIGCALFCSHDDSIRGMRISL